MQFEFATADKIVFGVGKLNSIGSIIAPFGDTALIISGAPSDISDRLINLLKKGNVNCSLLHVDQEPTIDNVTELIEAARGASPDTIIGIGGGSALDSAKTVAAMLNNPGDLIDYLEVIGGNRPLLDPSLPMIAIPTTSGTGSEVTRNAVIGSPTHHVKVSLRSSHLLPRIALVDPELTLSVPPNITAATGLDTLTQLIEPYTSNSSNPMTDVLCQEGIMRVSRSLIKVFDDGGNLQAREDMSLASLFSGLALANARLGAVHGLAGPIGGEIPAPHGATCASLLPQVMSVNIAALSARDPQHPALERYTKISKLLSGDPAAVPDTSVRWILDFNQRAKIQPLASYGLSAAQFPTIIEKARKANSMQGNPITLTDDELRNILQSSL